MINFLSIFKCATRKGALGLAMVTFIGTSGPLASGGDNSSKPSMERKVIEGAFAGMGVECPLFRLSTGEMITLTGAIPQLEVGQTVSLSGRWARISYCMQGRTFRGEQAPAERN